MPTNHDETLYERYARETAIDERLMAKCYPELAEKCAALENELANLRAWKAEQIAVTAPVIEYARSIGECPLGASLTEWLVADHKRLRANKTSNSSGFCGDPYVHDCGRTDCPLSDSYIKEKKQ